MTVCQEPCSFCLTHSTLSPLTIPTCWPSLPLIRDAYSWLARTAVSMRLDTRLKLAGLPSGVGRSTIRRAVFLSLYHLYCSFPFLKMVRTSLHIVLNMILKCCINCIAFFVITCIRFYNFFFLHHHRSTCSNCY